MATNNRQAQTMQQRLGFVDDDLKHPKHDDMVLEVEQHLDEIVSRLWEGSSLLGTPQREIAALRHRLPNIIIPDEIPGITRGGISKVTWEYPVVSGNKYIIGYIDLHIFYEGEYAGLWTEVGARPTHARWSVTHASVTLNIEVKPALPSIGELLRQIRTYQEYLPGQTFLVVCPDTRWAETLRKQGIYFLAPWW